MSWSIIVSIGHFLQHIWLCTSSQYRNRGVDARRPAACWRKRHWSRDTCAGKSRRAWSYKTTYIAAAMLYKEGYFSACLTAQVRHVCKVMSLVNHHGCMHLACDLRFLGMIETLCNTVWSQLHPWHASSPSLLLSLLYTLASLQSCMQHAGLRRFACSHQTSASVGTEA